MKTNNQDMGTNFSEMADMLQNLSNLCEDEEVKAILMAEKLTRLREENEALKTPKPSGAGGPAYQPMGGPGGGPPGSYGTGGPGWGGVVHPFEKQWKAELDRLYEENTNLRWELHHAAEEVKRLQKEKEDLRAELVLASTGMLYRSWIDSDEHAKKYCNLVEENAALKKVKENLKAALSALMRITPSSWINSIPQRKSL